MNRWPKYFCWVFATAIFVGVSGGLILAYWNRNLPPVESLEYFKPDIVTQIYDSQGEIFSEFFTERRIFLKRDEIPDHVVQSLLAAEDSGFYTHTGFDVPGILRAVFKNIVLFRKAQGASTITQQLARLLFLTNEKTYTRKIKEAMLALKIERRYSKNEILTLYLNQIYFGHGAYGVASAAQTFFRKPVSELTYAECATIVCVLKNPTLFSPFNHPDRALESRNNVLMRMKNAGFINEAEYHDSIDRPLGVAPAENSAKLAPYFAEEIRKYLVERLGNERVLTGGLKVFTTLNHEHQLAAETAIQAGLSAFRERHPDQGEIQAAFISIVPGEGDITSMVGGSDFAKTKFNRAMQAYRQSGSTIKPFVYYSALSQGVTPADIIVDEPFLYIDPKTRREWRPNNYDRRFHGPMTVRSALEQSNNIVTIKLLEKAGIPAVQDTARRAGIHSELPPYISLGLGTGELSLVDLTNAYATFAAMGLRTKPRLIKSIMDQTGLVIEKNQPVIEETLDARYCFLITRLLQGAVQRGSAWRARKQGLHIAAKTGTTDDYTDAWFVGYTQTLAAGTWIGHDLKQSMGSGETGSRAAGPIFESFMTEVMKSASGLDFQEPDGVIERIICQESGLLANESCPKKIPECFIKGTEPRQKCTLHPHALQ